MAKNFAFGNSVFLKNVRLTWADIHTPGDGIDGGAPKYKVSAILEKDSPAYLAAKDALLQAARLHWGANAEKMLNSMGDNSRFLRDGDKRMDDEGNTRPEYEGMWYISASNKLKPQVIGPRKHNGVFPTITAENRAMIAGVDVTHELGWEAKSPYSGCYVNLKIKPIAGKSFTVDSKVIPNQVYAQIEAIQFVRDGESFGRAAPSADGFDEEEVEAAANNEDNDLF